MGMIWFVCACVLLFFFVLFVGWDLSSCIIFFFIDGIYLVALFLLTVSFAFCLKRVEVGLF